MSHLFNVIRRVEDVRISKEKANYADNVLDKAVDYDLIVIGRDDKNLDYVGSAKGKRAFFSKKWNHRNKKTVKYRYEIDTSLIERIAV